MQNTAGEVAELWLELMPFAQGSGTAPLQRLAALGRDTPSLAKPPERLVLESPGQTMQQGGAENFPRNGLCAGLNAQPGSEGISP